LTKNTDAYWAKMAATVEAELMERVPENKLRPRLEPTRRAVELMGDPQRSYRVIHVTGTNGKTSTTRFIERILREHGLRTGRFTSPHLVQMTERIAIDGEPVSDQVFYEVWQDTKHVLEMVDAELLAQGDTRLTFFEALAVLGFAIFADAPVDVLVLEVGMGGLWDSTNVADGDVAVFTPIGIDHVERLGHTLTEIADTKAGIIKPGAIVVSALQEPEAQAVLKDRAANIADEFVAYGDRFRVTQTATEGFGQRFDVKGLAAEYKDLFIPILGAYQVENAALAIAAVEAFLGGGTLPITDDVLRVAIADVSSPGRLQVLSREPLVVLDAAHNPQGAQVLGQALTQVFAMQTFVGVVSVLAEKDAKAILRTLEQSLAQIIVTKSDSPRAIPVEELAELAEEIFGEHRVRTAYTAQQGLAQAFDMIADGEVDSIVVSGSITLVGDVLKLQQTKSDLLANDDDYDEADDVNHDEFDGTEGIDEDEEYEDE
jgi:dihydrofolate synthase/folylpolyglutamate synthase